MKKQENFTSPISTVIIWLTNEKTITEKEIDVVKKLLLVAAVVAAISTIVVFTAHAHSFIRDNISLAVDDQRLERQFRELDNKTNIRVAGIETKVDNGRLERVLKQKRIVRMKIYDEQKSGNPVPPFLTEELEDVENEIEKINNNLEKLDNEIDKRLRGSYTLSATTAES